MRGVPSDGVCQASVRDAKVKCREKRFENPKKNRRPGHRALPIIGQLALTTSA